MPKSLYPGSMIKMPGVPDEDENQVLAALPATPETDIEAYQRLSKEASEAAPTEQDVLMAGVRRSLAETQAAGIPYLEKAAETAFYKPDYSKMAEATKIGLGRPDAILTAKEQAQKRLESLAEGARKRALLPAEMAEKEAKTLKTQEELRTLKQKGVPLSEDRRKLYENMINSFISRNNLGDPVSLPEAVTEEDANRLLTSSKSGDTTSWRTARLEFDKEEAGRRQQRFLMGYEQKGEERAEKQSEKEVVVGDEAYKGRTTAEAKDLRGSVAAFNTIKNSLNDLKTQYANINIDNYQKAPRAIQEMNTIGNDLIMRIKDLYGLGAPQTAELQFLYGLLGTSPNEVLKNILMDKTLGTSFPEKLDTIERVYSNGLKSALEAKAVKKEGGGTSLPKSKEGTPSSAKPSTPAAKPAKPVVIQKGQPLPD